MATGSRPGTRSKPRRRRTPAGVVLEWTAVVPLLVAGALGLELTSLGPRSWAWTVAGVAAAGWYAAVVLHELAHALALSLVGGEVGRIRIGVTSAVERLGSLRPHQTLVVALAGPATNLLLAVPGLVLTLTRPPVSRWFVVPVVWWLPNLVMAARNLAPAGHSDGAQASEALRALRARRAPRPPDGQGRGADHEQ